MPILNRKQLVLSIAAGLFQILYPFGVSAASTRANLEHINGSQFAPVPDGWRQFCRERVADCRRFGPIVSSVPLSADHWSDLVQVNAYFNRKIRPVSDRDQYGSEERWTYADSGSGDCEDFVLEKRRELIRRGWPSSVLLITVVLDKEQLGHAVLTVETQKGEFVLDNQEESVKLWSKTGLTFVKRQASSDPNTWINLGWTVGDPAQITAGLGH